MNDPSSQLYLGENSGPVPIARIVARAYLWLVGAGASIMMLVFAVATQSDREAGRIAGNAGGYAASLVSAMAVTQGRRHP